MNTYFFVLGNNFTLSILEIFMVLNKADLKYKVELTSKEVLIINSNAIIPGDILNKLGGSIKFGQIYKQIESNKFKDDFEKLYIDINFLSLLFNPEINKIHFGISLYSGGIEEHNLRYYSTLINRSIIPIKKFLQQSYKVSFIKPDQRYLSSVSVDKNKLISNGFELVICAGKNQVYLGNTIAIQDYKDYGFRDFGRPKRDTEIGILPPKLAKIMVNLAGCDQGDLILDPFCGNGTILQEAILLNHQKLFGIDISSVQIDKTNENIDWLFKYYKLPKEQFKIDIEQGDVLQILNFLPERSVKAIITEPYLGSSKAAKMNYSEFEKELTLIENLYQKAFIQFAKILKPEGKIVIVFPLFMQKQKAVYLEILPQIKKSGFKIINPLSEFYYLKSDLKITRRESVVYSRPNQFINREIFIFQKSGH